MIPNLLGTPKSIGQNEDIIQLDNPLEPVADCVASSANESYF